MSDSIFTTCILIERVHIQPRYLNRNLLKSITNALVNNVEGRCTRHGYVRTGSVFIVEVLDGCIQMEAGSVTVFDVRFKADVCNPLVHSVVVCHVENVNNYGALATNAIGDRILEIIIPSEPRFFEHKKPVSEVVPGDTLHVVIKGKRFQLHQASITCVGQIVDAVADISTEPPVTSNVALKLPTTDDSESSVDGETTPKSSDIDETWVDSDGDGEDVSDDGEDV